MAFKRSAVRSRLSPPKGVYGYAQESLGTVRFQGFFLFFHVLRSALKNIEKNQSIAHVLLTLWATTFLRSHSVENARETPKLRCLPLLSYPPQSAPRYRRSSSFPSFERGPLFFPDLPSERKKHPDQVLPGIAYSPQAALL